MDFCPKMLFLTIEYVKKKCLKMIENFNLMCAGITLCFYSYFHGSILKENPFKVQKWPKICIFDIFSLSAFQCSPLGNTEY